MRRREFIRLLGGATAALPFAASAQQAAMPVIGFLHTGIADRYTNVLAGFRQGLKEAGFEEGQNVAIQFRWANDQPGRLPTLAAELVRRRVAVILAGGGAASALSAKAATSTIPIVLALGSDPVQLGLVASLNQPGGNVTGVTFITTELVAKRLDLLRELVPEATTIAFLFDPGNPTAKGQMSDMLAAAQALGQRLVVLEARSDHDFERAFTTLAERRAGALVVGAFQLFTSNSDKLVALAARYKIPAIYQHREFALNGGLISYGASIVDAYRQGGLYVGQILKGENPGDLPVQQSTKVELVINLRTAQALGITIPPTLLVRADEVIE